MLGPPSMPESGVRSVPRPGRCGQPERGSRAAWQVGRRAADARGACGACPTGPIKAVAALARTFGGRAGPAWVLLPASVPPSIEEFHGIRMQFGHIPCLPRVILPASGPLPPIDEHPTALVEVFANHFS